MLIKNVTKEQLKEALRLVNEKYNYNITWGSFYREEHSKYRVTLMVKDSKGPGHRLSQPHYSTGKQIRMRYACWHVHGDFFDTLLSINQDTEIHSLDKVINKYGGNWQDWNIGSEIFPMMYSEACECNR